MEWNAVVIETSLYSQSELSDKKQGLLTHQRYAENCRLHAVCMMMEATAQKRGRCSRVTWEEISLDPHPCSARLTMILLAYWCKKRNIRCDHDVLLYLALLYSIKAQIKERQ